MFNPVSPVTYSQKCKTHAARGNIYTHGAQRLHHDKLAECASEKFD